MDVRPDELEKVFVRGHDEHVKPGFLREPGARGDQVVGLEALDGPHGEAVAEERLARQRDLMLERRVALGPVRLVVRVDGLAEVRRRIAADSDVRLTGRERADLGDGLAARVVWLALADAARRMSDGREVDQDDLSRRGRCRYRRDGLLNGGHWSLLLGSASV